MVLKEKVFIVYLCHVSEDLPQADPTRWRLLSDVAVQKFYLNLRHGYSTVFSFPLYHRYHHFLPLYNCILSSLLKGSPPRLLTKPLSFVGVSNKAYISENSKLTPTNERNIFAESVWHLSEQLFLSNCEFHILIFLNS